MEAVCRIADKHATDIRQPIAIPGERLMRIVLALVVLATLAILVLVGLEFDKVVAPPEQEQASAETETTTTGDADEVQTSDTVDGGSATGDSAGQAGDTGEETGTATTEASSADAGSEATDDAAADVADDTVRPSFDIVRVERTGDAVMAGRATPNATVEVFDHNGLVATVQADENGDWVVVLDEPLEPGSHELWLESTEEGGEQSVASDQTVVMLVPDADDANSGASVTVTTNTDAGAGTDEAIAVLVPKDGEGQVEILQEPNEGIGIAGGDGLSLDTLDYDEVGDVTLTGRAEPGAEVRAYVDGELAGRALADSSGDWTMTLDEPVDLGLHALRVEQVDQEGQVLGRLETPFDRESLQFPESAEPLVIIQPGNNLWTIARHTYGSGVHYTQIFRANENQIADPHLIYPGQIFVLPTIN